METNAGGKAKAIDNGRARAAGVEDAEKDGASAQVLKEAMALKSAWGRAKSRAESLAMLIKEGDDYAWANNAQNVGKLQEALGELGAAAAGGFPRMFLACEARAVKEQFGDTWVHELKAYVALAPKVKSLEKLTATMSRMHKTRTA